MNAGPPFLAPGISNRSNQIKSNLVQAYISTSSHVDNWKWTSIYPALGSDMKKSSEFVLPLVSLFIECNDCNVFNITYNCTAAGLKLAN